ncbi:nucleotidyltransferase domain-containing protein [Asticcacaulis solisilvae]|uniref:nucleotidyltransferase domain-containing protein n=1 Tax=Asticcacaulis solisilvae TaxID=1217274 RepID=UPI003FD7D36C
MTAVLPAYHQAFVDRLCAAIPADGRIDALLAGGSLVHGGVDEQSDIDIVVVVRDDAYAGLMEAREAFAAKHGVLLSAFTGEHVGEPRLLICLYGPPLLHVDFKFVVAGDLASMVERPLVLWARDETAITARLDAARIAWPDRDADWFEARAWVWLHYGAAKVLRGELHEALSLLSFFQMQVLGPMLHRRAGRSQRGTRRIEAYGLDPEGLLQSTIAGHDARAIRAALLASADVYLLLRADAPPSRSVASMPEALRAYLA